MAEYNLTREELKECDFDQVLEHVSKLVFEIGGYFQGRETRTATISGDEVKIHVDNFLLSFDKLPVPDQDFTHNKEEFIEEIRAIHIGEWEKDYDDPCVLDGTQWELEIHYSNGRKPVKIGGSNAYPDNFDALLEAMGVDGEKAITCYVLEGESNQNSDSTE